MLKLSDIMTRELVTLSPDHTLRDAMAILASRHISGAPVMANDTVVGVVSLTDLVEFAASSPGVPTERPEDSAWDEIDDGGAALPEDDDPAVKFFAELWDDAGADVSGRMESPGGPEWNMLEEHTVGEAMTRRIYALPPTAPVEFGARYMRSMGIHRVLVIARGKLLGIVTTKDIADAVADRRFVTRRYVFGHPEASMNGRGRPAS